MKWKLIIILLLLIFLSFNNCYGSRQHSRRKRQVSLDDLIQGALQLVKPIFDTSAPIRDNSMIPKQGTIDETLPSDSHQKAALGVQEDAVAIREAPICRGNSQICKFIACSAHNFKHNQNFANLNLAAQLVSDPKLRKTITNNPEAVISVCREQGLSESQCRMFSQGFQVIDKFFNVVEPSKNKNGEGGGMIMEDSAPASPSLSASPSMAATAMDSLSSPSTPSSSATSSSIAKQKDRIFQNAMDDDPSIIQHISRAIRPIGRSTYTSSFQQQQSMMGSRTWSTHKNPVLSSSDSLISISRPSSSIIIPQNNNNNDNDNRENNGNEIIHPHHFTTTEKKIITPSMDNINDDRDGERHISTTPIHIPTSHISTSPIVPVIQRPTAKAPPLPPLQMPSPLRPSTNSVIITRPRRYITFMDILKPRNKRDSNYYEQMSRMATPIPYTTETPKRYNSNSNFPNIPNPANTDGGGDYYDNLDSSESSSKASIYSSSSTKQRGRGGSGGGGSNFTPLNCLSLLG